ncbi:SpoIIE family protein phosphatase [Actinacidiphila glaucinigra]|uniref:SpoIIE family protein phosphatase n=1 Tax=Actinacidiphila glaucinigra TaxID=235986 RepID=UPI003D8F0E28
MACIAEERQDELFARAVERIVRELDAFVAVVFLVEKDGCDLSAAAVGGPPPAVFTVPHRIGRESTHISSIAWHTGRPAASGLPTEDPDTGPSRLVSYPYSVAAVPLTSGGVAFGTLTALWVPPRPSEMPHLLDRLTAAGARLEADLGSHQAQLNPSSRRPLPVIVPVLETKSWPADVELAAAHHWGVSEFAGSAAMSQMYYFHKLSASLNRASGATGVVQAASEWIMKPFGACGLVLTVVREGRLQVVGYDGGLTLARSIHNAPLDHRNPTADVLETRKPLFLSDRAALLNRYPDVDVTGLEALVVLPIIGSGHLLSSLTLGFDTARDFPAEDQALLLMMTAHLAVAMERESLSEAERTLFEALQRKHLPRTLPEWSELVSTARYQAPPAAYEMGGDWYDVIPLPDQQVGIVVGDVEGHSADSAVIMGQLRSSLHAYAAEGHNPADILCRSSSLLAELDTDLYATCCFVRIDLQFGNIEVALAGHPPPLLRTPDGTIVSFEAPANLPLAVSPGEHVYTTVESPITPGTLIMLYTDGLASEPGGDSIRDAHRLLESVDGVERSSLQSLADAIMQGAAASHRLSCPTDDIVMLLALYEGPPPTTLPRAAHMTIARHDIRAVRAARHFVGGYLQQRGLSSLVSDLEVIVSEAVTNALIHADSEVELRLRDYPDRIHLEVRDTDAKPPIPTAVTQSLATNEVAEHGRGMAIVDNLSAMWGSSPNGRGKTVWAEVSKPE